MSADLDGSTHRALRKLKQQFAEMGKQMSDYGLPDPDDTEILLEDEMARWNQQVHALRCFVLHHFDSLTHSLWDDVLSVTIAHDTYYN